MAKKKDGSGTLSLFGEPEAPAAGVSDYSIRNRERIRRWASKGIRFGTSSWKYPGWKGQVYNRPYDSKKAFEQNCLTEYAELFTTVSGDFALYAFPGADDMKVLHDATPGEFKVSLKVTDRITIKRYPAMARYGTNAGKENPDFLNVALFEDAFLKPIEELKGKRGAIIFEFSTFFPESGMACGTFVEAMDAFLSRLPKGYEYAVEVRNKEFLREEYFQMLHAHEAAHVLNNWTRMPPIMEQIRVAGVLTGKFSVTRALLRSGRTYKESVDQFAPYDRLQEENPELRAGLVESVTKCLAEGKTLYAYVNNRAEGNAPKTIEGILDMLDRYPAEKL
jgi:uncharacterized protein YecE (DUF72 family)